MKRRIASLRMSDGHYSRPVKQLGPAHTSTHNPSKPFSLVGHLKILGQIALTISHPLRICRKSEGKGGEGDV